MIQRPALRYMGSKWRLGDWIINRLPTHECYVEPFSGSAAVLLQKTAASTEVLNDLDGEIMNFWWILRERTEDLIRALKLTPWSRAEYEKAQQRVIDPLERARRFYVRCWQTRGSGSANWRSGWRFFRIYDGGGHSVRLWDSVEHLFDVAGRLKTVQLENDTALKVMERFDGDSTLFYVDPPYVASTRSRRWRSAGYKHEMSDNDHRKLLRQLKKFKAMVVVSGYPNRLYDAMLRGWETDVIKMNNGLSAKPKMVTEKLWMNAAAVRGHGQKKLF